MKVPETCHHAHEHDLTSIQCLRGVAAIMVVIFHAVSHIEHIRDPQGLIKALTAGVDIFFVISGFIMLYSFQRTPGRNGTRFLLNRVLRIAPMYWLLTLLTVLIALVLPHAMQNGRLEPLHVVKSFLFVPAINPVSHMYEPILIPGWTLNYEMFFYVIFALGLGLAREKMDVLVAFVLSTLVVIASLPALFPVSGVASFYTAPIIVEFGYGLIVCRLFLVGFRPSRSASIAMIVASAIGFMVSPLLAQVAPREMLYGIPAVLGFTGTVNLRLNPKAPIAVVLKSIGDASYSLYLVHPILISAMGQSWEKLGLHKLPGQLTLFVVLSVALCVVAGFLLYRFIEQPAIERLKRVLG